MNVDPQIINAAIDTACRATADNIVAAASEIAAWYTQQLISGAPPEFFSLHAEALAIGERHGLSQTMSSSIFIGMAKFADAMKEAVEDEERRERARRRR